MATTFRPYEPDQMLLLAPDVRDWLTEGHFAHHVSDLVDGLDLTAFYAPYEGDGRRNAPYEPRMMVKVLVYGYATGVFSSRGMARKLEEDVAFRVLGAGNFPSHRTLCEFRRRHLEEFKGLFVEVVCLAREVGLLSFGKLSIDGTKVRANASKRKAMSYGRMGEEARRLEGEIEALLKQARDTDAEEDARFGESLRGDELPEELRRREDRLAAIVAAKARLEAAQREADDARGRRPEWERHPKGGQPYKRAYGEPEDKAQSNFTDPDSAIMKTSAEGFQQCDNAQVAVDGEHQLIVATELTSNASDQGAMVGLLDEVKDTFDAQPETVLADAGYCNERDLSELEARGIDGYVAPGRFSFLISLSLKVPPDVARFQTGVFGRSTFSALAYNVDTLLVAQFAGAVDVGLYRAARQITDTGHYPFQPLRDGVQLRQAKLDEGGRHVEGERV